MDGVIEALHIVDERNAPILSHVYAGRPLPAAQLLPLYFEQQRQEQGPASAAAVAAAAVSTRSSLSSSSSVSRRQPASLVYLRGTSPPTLVFSAVHASGGLLFLLTTTSELEPLLALEFLHRVADALEDFLGSPLLAGKIESSYDVVAQLLTEMCDAGLPSTTEPNALRDLVEVEGLVGKLLGSITLPSKAAAALSSAAAAAAAAASASSPSLSSVSASPRSASPAPLLSSLSSSSSSSAATPALPWRRANVRHTSNEMYADVVESLSVTLAPSGRPLAAFAHGSIAFTAKVSGLPDILLTLTGPAGKHGLASLLELPVFHPCVRLARWRERPGELSFVPPDGRFVLAAYEVDLMPLAGASSSSSSSSSPFSPSASSHLRLPVTVDVQSNLGPVGADFEVRVHVNRMFGSSSAGNSSSSGMGGGGGGGGGAHPGSPGAPLLEDVHVTVPLPAGVRNLLEIRPTRGDAVYSPGEHVLEWHIPAKDVASGAAHFGLRCTVVGQAERREEDDIDDDDDDDDDNDGGDGGVASHDDGLGFQPYTYDEPYQQPVPPAPAPPQETRKKGKKSKRAAEEAREKDGAAVAAAAAAAAAASAASAAADRRRAQNKMLMPSAATLSFAVKGWLASGVRIESIVLDTKRSRGLGDGVKPFKGVKYLTVSKGGIELRC